MASRHLQIIVFPAIDCSRIVLYSVLQRTEWNGDLDDGILASPLLPAPKLQTGTLLMPPQQVSQKGAAP